MSFLFFSQKKSPVKNKILLEIILVFVCLCLLQEVIITEMGFAKDEYIQLQDECP